MCCVCTKAFKDFYSERDCTFLTLLLSLNYYSVDTVKCDCPLSCNQTKYKAEISFSKLLDHDKTISDPVNNWFSDVNEDR